jgi:hypothetical protein
MNAAKGLGLALIKSTLESMAVVALGAWVWGKWVTRAELETELATVKAGKTAARKACRKVARAKGFE